MKNHGMKVLLTGTDEAGRSCVTETIETPVPMGHMASQPLFHSRRQAPLAPNPAGERRDLGVADGELAWSVVLWAPDQTFDLHHTDTVDLDTVLTGSMILTLEDGEHHLGVGDAVVMNGVAHSWRSGPEGCSLSVAAYGRTRG